MEKRIQELEEELFLLYSSSKRKSTPSIVELIDKVVDDLILLKNLLLEDNLEEAKNPALIFLEHLQDVLGNPQQIKIKDSRTIIYDPQLAKICQDFALVLVNFKRTFRQPLNETDFESYLRTYLNKEMRRTQFARKEQEAFYFLLQEEFPGKNDRRILLKFLQWVIRNGY
jgi:hypothetical protein